MTLGLNERKNPSGMMEQVCSLHGYILLTTDFSEGQEY